MSIYQINFVVVPATVCVPIATLCQHTVLCKSLESHIIYLYFVMKIGNKCNDLLNPRQQLIEMQYIRQQHHLYNSIKHESQYLVSLPFFFSTA